MSLTQLSAGTGLSLTFLSRLEGNKVNISIDNLRKITGFLDIPMVRLFEVDENRQLGTVTRKGEGTRLKIIRSSAYSESLIRKSNSNIQATLYINPPGEGRRTPVSHHGEEFIYVITGEILIFLGKEKHHLKAGDSIHFRSEVMHSWVNPGKKVSRVISFNSPQAR
jgi:mannose-6-phosphate isomerase-like protein (cupin superfamily)